MATEYIRDYRGSIIARIETRSNGDQVIYGATGMILGRYIRGTNVTLDARGCIVARGNAIHMLISGR